MIGKLKWYKIVIDQIFECLHFVLCKLPSEWLVDFMSIHQVGIPFATNGQNICFLGKITQNAMLTIYLSSNYDNNVTGANRKLETAILDCINISRALPDVNSYN